MTPHPVTLHPEVVAWATAHGVARSTWIDPDLMATAPLILVEWFARLGFPTAEAELARRASP